MPALYDPQVEVNDTVVEIIPNSFKYKRGAGERKTRTASGGGGRLSTYNTEDITTKQGEISFMLIMTDENKELVENWQDRFDANTVRFTEAGVGGTMNNAIIQNEPQFTVGLEGEVEVIFTGDPLI